MAKNNLKNLKKKTVVYGKDDVVKPEVDYSKYADLLRSFTLDSLHLTLEEFIRNHKNKGYSGEPLTNMLRAVIETYMGHFTGIVLRDHKLVYSLEGDLNFTSKNEETIEIEVTQRYTFKEHYKVYQSIDTIVIPYSI